MSVPFADPRSKKLLISLFLVLSTLLAYRYVKDCWFINYDDNLYITNNIRVQNGLTWENVIWAFTTSTASNWHPVTWLSHMTDCQLYGMNAAGHHFMSVVFHTANVVILFLLLNYLTGTFWRSAFVAALFALHPLNVQSVAWIAERKNVLSTLFWLLTMWSYAWYVRKGGWQRYLITLLTFALGLMSKPMLVTLPFVLLLMDYWPLKRFVIWENENTQPNEELNQITGQTSLQLENNTLSKRLLIGLIVEKIPLFMMAFILSFVTFIAQRASNALMPGEQTPIEIRLLNALLSYCKYIYKTFYPTHLALFYPYPEAIPLTHVALALLLLLGITLLAVLSKKGYLIFGWLWFVGTLVPVIGIIQVGGQAMADRYVYVPLIGLFIMVSWLAADLTKRFPARQIMLCILSASILLSLGLITRRQVSYWKDSFTVLIHAMNVVPNNYIAANNLGIIYMKLGNREEALKTFELSIKYAPTLFLAHFNAGVALIELNREKEGLLEFKKVLDDGHDRENMARVHVKMGELESNKGNNEEAIKHYLSAIECDRSNPAGYYFYGLLLSKEGKYDEAIVQFHNTIQITPEPAGYYQLGVALEAQQKWSEAIKAYQEVLKLRPDDNTPKEAIDRIKNNMGAS